MPTLPAQAASPPPVPAAQRQGFQLGLALQEPAAHTAHFLEAVKALKDLTDDSESQAQVAKLAKQAVDLRGTEARAYDRASQMLHTMGAPQSLQTWTTATARSLRAPLVLSKEAKREEKSDPNTASVLGTIDEASAVKVGTDGHMPSLVTWLRLAQGRDALWASVLGGLAAGMDAAVTTDQSLSLSPTDVRQIYESAPVGTPPAVLNTLSEIAPPRGNLAPLIRLPARLFSAKELSAPRRTLLDTYRARPLANAIDRGP